MYIKNEESFVQIFNSFKSRWKLVEIKRSENSAYEGSDWKYRRELRVVGRVEKGQLN